jgi:cyclomaltodextrinase
MKMRITFATATLVCFLLTGCSTHKTRDDMFSGDWQFRIDSLDRGVAERWFAVDSKRDGWSIHSLPNLWDRYDDLASYDGIGWYAKSFEVRDTINPVSLCFDGVDDDAVVWLNGTKVGSHAGYSEPFYFDVTGTVRYGRNEIVIRVADQSGPGGIYGSIHLVRSEDVKKLLKSKYADRQARPSVDWVRNAVIYELYVRSFSKEGTFKGVEGRLAELKSLGVDVLWLMPIHPVGEINRKGKLGSPYAVQDYYEVNEEFGTLDDFKSLVGAVHRLNMKIIIDLVANHTSWDSKLIFEHPEWFKKNEEGAIVSPNPDWADVAQLNYGHHELRKYMIEMMKYWVRDVGIDGFRCDVAELVPTEFWNIARRELDKIKPVMMLSEGKLPEHHLEAFDLTYSWNVYDVLSNVIHDSLSVKIFDDILEKENYQYPRNSLRLRFNTNHDKNAWDAPAVKKFTPAGAKATAVLVFTFPGVPLVYNGEEVGNPKSLSLFEKTDIDWSKDTGFRELYTKLAHLRREHSALREGDYRRVACSDSNRVFAFARKSGNDEVLSVINFSKRPVKVSVAVEHDMRDCLTGKVFTRDNTGIGLTLSTLGYYILANK